jgi:quaternary ammonium compound-resistance protein SugE
MSWVYLCIAGLFEIGWPLGFKLSQVTSFRIQFLIGAALSMVLSGYFLWLAQRELPIGTAYAVWTGIGALGTFLIGIFFFGDSIKMLRILSFFLILIGVIGLKIHD